ncbi:HAD-IIIA family hydrolase [Tissierella sp.]|uniref:D-glycero-alpha-D-manno-heptose-1,7-bisphosphate 7-phosphatase n=1 Tax=Tissierella sp. TaxID=41274 RepID=UPI002866EDBA|nr:HAD-IIIA family hydrolase [Tissierella sp.]MDR7855250.1 HAD-IIIA family hydrolase [Tissierella sp.]
MKVAFVDRDGTINKDYQDDDWRYIYEPELLDGSLEALKVISQKGYHIIIITNQYLINDGIITLLQYRKFTEKLLLELNNNEIDILDTLYCPHSRKENCNCFKPKTGLVDMALKKYPHIELDKSFTVGDSVSDVELGNKFGIMTFGINVNSELFDYTRIKSLLDIIKYL